MSGAQKVSISLLISVVVFSVLAILVSVDRFRVLETAFFIPRVEESIRSRAEQAAGVSDAFHRRNLERFGQFVSEDAIRAAFRINASAAQIQERRERLDALEAEQASLDRIRIIDLDATQLHYSSDPADYVESATQRTYLRPDDASEDEGVQLGELAFFEDIADDFELPTDAEIPASRIFLNPEANQFIYRLPVLDTSGILQGAALFYVNVLDLSTTLVRNGLIGTGDQVRVVNDDGLVLRVPAQLADILVETVRAQWSTIAESDVRVTLVSQTDAEQSEDTADIPAPPEGAPPPRYEAFAVQPSVNGMLVYLEPSSSLEMSLPLQYTLIGAIFLTTFLIVFLILSVRQDAMVVLRDKVKRFQVSLLREYMEAKEEIDFERWRAELEDRREEVNKQVRRGLRKLKAEQEAEVDDLINRTWDEIIDVFSSRAQAKPSIGGDLGRIEDIVDQLTRRLASTPLNVQSAPVSATPSSATPSSSTPESGRTPTPVEVEELDDGDDVDDIEEIGADEELDDGDELEEVESVDVVEEADEYEQDDEDDEEIDVVEELEEETDEERGEDAELEEVAAVEEIHAAGELAAEEVEPEEIDAEELTEELTEEFTEEIDEVEEAEDVEPLQPEEEGGELPHSEPEPVAIETASDEQTTPMRFPAGFEPDSVTFETLNEQAELEWLAAGEVEPDELTFGSLPSPRNPSKPDLQLVRENEEDSSSRELEPVESPDELEGTLEVLDDGEEELVESLESVDVDVDVDTDDEEELLEAEDDSPADDLEELQVDESDEEPLILNELPVARHGSTTFGAGLFGFGPGTEVRLPRLVQNGPQRSHDEPVVDHPVGESANDDDEVAELADLEPVASERPLRRAARDSRLVRIAHDRPISTDDYEIADVSEVLGRLHISKSILVEEDGVFQIDRTAYQAPIAAKDQSVNTLIREVTGGAIDGDTPGVEELFGGSADDELSEFASVGQSRDDSEDQVGISVFRFTDQGFDYDGFLRGYKRNDSGLLKSMVSFTRYWNARVGIVFQSRDIEHQPYAAIGIDDRCRASMVISKSSSVARNILNKGRVLFIKRPLTEVEYFKDLCSPQSLAFFERSLFLPVVLAGARAYFLLGLRGNLDSLDDAFRSVLPILQRSSSAPVGSVV